MDIYLIVLRLVHIVAAVLWVGTGFFTTVILVPTVVRLGTDAAQFIRGLGQSSVFKMVFPVSAGVTVLAGILLYLKPGESSHFSSTGWIVLSIGALAGIIGAIHGGAILGRMTGVYMGKLASGSADSGELSTLGAKLLQHANISLVLAVVALVGMASARYL